MAMSYSPSGRAGSKTILINCWWAEDRFSASLLCLEIQFWNRLCMLFSWVETEKSRLRVDCLMNNMLIYVCLK